MDSRTVAVYDNLTETFTQEWRDQPAPEDLHVLLRHEFKAGGAIVNISCGVDRRVAWLNTSDYPAVGYDTSTALLEMARE